MAQWREYMRLCALADEALLAEKGSLADRLN